MLMCKLSHVTVAYKFQSDLEAKNAILLNLQNSFEIMQKQVSIERKNMLNNFNSLYNK